MNFFIYWVNSNGGKDYSYRRFSYQCSFSLCFQCLITCRSMRLCVNVVSIGVEFGDGILFSGNAGPNYSSFHFICPIYVAAEVKIHRAWYSQAFFLANSQSSTYNFQCSA